MDVFVGIEGANINESKVVAMEELNNNGKLRLTLNVTAPLGGNNMIGNN